MAHKSIFGLLLINELMGDGDGQVELISKDTTKSVWKTGL